jgi:hypothetical protein
MAVRLQHRYLAHGEDALLPIGIHLRCAPTTTLFASDGVAVVYENILMSRDTRASGNDGFLMSPSKRLPPTTRSNRETYGKAVCAPKLSAGGVDIPRQGRSS